MYKGFKNRETWTVNHHLQNSVAWYQHYKFIAPMVESKALAESIKLDISLSIPDSTPFILRDLLEDVLDAVDWEEVANSFYE